jgi:hypothetical protein
MTGISVTNNPKQAIANAGEIGNQDCPSQGNPPSQVNPNQR